MSGFAILVPVLGRPERAQPLVDSIRDNSAYDHQIVFIISPEDGAQYWACAATGEVCFVVEFESGHADFARKINDAFKHPLTADYEYVFQAADDLEFQTGWDVAALSVADASGAGVVGTNDGANPKVIRGDHSTHSLVSRRYIDTLGGSLDGPGLVFSEVYGHMYCDNELVELAKARGMFIFAHSSRVYHRHPTFSRNVEHDPTYAKGQATARADHLLWRERQAKIR